jgi:hypothetical protein
MARAARKMNFIVAVAGTRETGLVGDDVEKSFDMFGGSEGVERSELDSGRGREGAGIYAPLRDPSGQLF